MSSSSEKTKQKKCCHCSKSAAASLFDKLAVTSRFCHTTLDVALPPRRALIVPEILRLAKNNIDRGELFMIDLQEFRPGISETRTRFLLEIHDVHYVLGMNVALFVFMLNAKQNSLRCLNLKLT